MANVMAILQEVDKCIRCNGCYIACKRTWNMKAGDAANHGKHRVNYYQRVVIKSQKKTDMGPFIRFSCWHCEFPPCTGRCPYNAINKMPSGAVYVDPALCDPVGCAAKSGGVYPCQADCQRGGYPKIGAGTYDNQFKAWKCTLCESRAGLGGNLPTKAVNSGTVSVPKYLSPISGLEVPELQHQPTCVYTCPAKAMTYDTRDNIRAKISAMHDAAVANSTTFSALGDGSMYWVSTKAILTPPKADPFVEDHVTPMVSEVLSSPFAAAAIVPTLVVGGLLAVSARRAENEKEAALAMEGEV